MNIASSLRIFLSILLLCVSLVSAKDSVDFPILLIRHIDLRCGKILVICDKLKFQGLKELNEKYSKSGTSPGTISGTSPGTITGERSYTPPGTYGAY